MHGDDFDWKVKHLYLMICFSASEVTLITMCKIDQYKITKHNKSQTQEYIYLIYCIGKLMLNWKYHTKGIIISSWILVLFSILLITWIWYSMIKLISLVPLNSNWLSLLIKNAPGMKYSTETYEKQRQYNILPTQKNVEVNIVDPLGGMFNSSPPGQNGHHFADDIFKCIFVNEKVCILIQIS